MTKYQYFRKDVGPKVRFYASSSLEATVTLGSAEEYARARSAMPTWCLDGLVCGTTSDGRPAVVLVIRSGRGLESGPFRNEPWVVGGKWDMVTPWEDFVRHKVTSELFSGRFNGAMTVDGPIGDQLFATGWGRDTDGPFGYHGVTVQFCYRVLLSTPIEEKALQPSPNHSGYIILPAEAPFPALHPYILDVIELSGWLR